MFILGQDLQCCVCVCLLGRRWNGRGWRNGKGLANQNWKITGTPNILQNIKVNPPRKKLMLISVVGLVPNRSDPESISEKHSDVDPVQPGYVLWEVSSNEEAKNRNNR